MKRGGFDGAFKTYRDAVGFPLIASALCHAPCKGVCSRKETDSAIELLLLEKACISFAGDRSPTDYNLPAKKKKVAVIGAGISGLACALRLCMKKYEVEIYEAADRIGGSLWELMEPEVFLTDIEEQLKHEKYALHFNTQIRGTEDLIGHGFDAVYVATGDGGADFGLLSASEGNDQHCALYGNVGWFAGGGLTGEEPVYALAKGLSMGTVIDNFLKTGNLFNPDNRQNTKMCLNPAKLNYEEPVVPEHEIAYNKTEAIREASRCIPCQCDFCRTYCDLTDYYNKWPLRIRDEIMATTLPGWADVKATPAKRLLSTCNQCGLCMETCPEEIDLGGLILAGRKSMHKQKKAPWVFHDFWLRDMEFANGDLTSITMGSYPGSVNKQQRNTYAFFPGCQLGASDPKLVERTYRYLLRKQPDTGLMLRCCGVPAEWSGDEEKFCKEMEIIRALWKELGQPTLILACPTCEKKFKTNMPDIPVISLYEILDDWKIKAAAAGEPETVYSVFDACAAKHEKNMKLAVRRLAENAGCMLQPLEQHDAFEQCCGYGGQPAIANPQYTAFVVQKRISESENPYITYCINCREIFTEAGKEAIHILDILFGDGKAPERSATVSERRENRIQLKYRLLKEFWHENMTEPKKKFEIEVSLSPELSEKLNEERILEEDVIAVIDFCERTGRKVSLPETGAFSGYLEIGYLTYWVEYKATDLKDTFELVNAYTHRIKIELEVVWNGRKTDADLR